MKRSNFLKSLTRYMIAFLAVAFAFLALGLGTLGTVRSVGKSYELAAKQKGDEKEPCIILQLSAPEGLSSSNITVKDVYINVGAVYAENGEPVTLRVARGTSSTSAFSTYADLTYYGMYKTVEEKVTVTVPGEVDEETGEVGEPTQKEETVTKTVPSDFIGNWVSIAKSGEKWSEAGYTLSTYSYYKITSVQQKTNDKPCNILISEMVFIGEDRTLVEEKRVPIVIPAKVHEESVLYGAESGVVSGEDAIKAASAIIDSQHLPSLVQSSFFRYGAEEVYTLSSVLEMQQGSTVYTGDVYHGDKVYNALGTDILALGTTIFGTSPFGLRFFPMLASFGILVFGFFFVRKLLKSDKAGFIFALLYVLSSVFLSLGHFGAPLTVGLFFLVASLYCCYCFFAGGMKKANFKSAVPLLLSGLFGAMAICVNGAYLIPVLGVVGLFVAGMFRQQKVRRHYLDLAVAAAEEEKKALATQKLAQGETPDMPAKQHLADVYNEYRYKNSVAPAIFSAFLILGFVFVSMLSLIPVYYLYGKLYGQGINIFKMLLCGFTGGYTGVNELAAPQSMWKIFYELFRGTGETYAITAAGLLPAVIAVAAGFFGLVMAILRLVTLLRGEKTGSVRSELRSLCILFGGIVLSLVTAAFAKGGLAFILLSYFFAFGLAAFGEKTLTNTLKETEEKGTMQKIWCAIQIVWLVFLIAFFVLFSCFTFSFPLPAAFMTKLLG